MSSFAELHAPTSKVLNHNMTLEDFEKDLATSKQKNSHHHHRDRRKDEERSSQRHHHRHHHSSKHSESRHQDEDGHRHKRRRRSPDHEKDEHKRQDEREHRHHHRDGQNESETQVGEEIVPSPSNGLKRDSWMEAPSALDIDYVQRRRQSPSPPKATSLGADFELKLHDKELNHHLRDLHNHTPEGDGLDEPAQREVSYNFGDAGSKWRMTKLKQVYRQAEESRQRVEDVALERYGDLGEFDDAREEEIELDRRGTYGTDYVGKDKPSGELFQERKMAAGIKRSPEEQNTAHGERPNQDAEVLTEQPQPTTQSLDQTSLNKLKAQLLKAQLRKDPSAARLEEEYNEAVAAASNRKLNNHVVILSAMDNRMLSSTPRNEAKPVLNRRGRERGLVEENDDMTIDDMVREERRTRGQAGGEGQRFAERIAKDGKFDNDLEYLDENASKLAKRVQKSELNLRNTTISEFQKMNRILDTCPLCHHEDTNTPPVAPVVSLATRTYLTLPTEPEISKPGACIIPIQHRTNLLECDDDEWEEVRNFMKSLTRLYHDMGQDVIFYENAAHSGRKRHASMEAVPLPRGVGGDAPAFFREAFLASESEWSQHKKIIDTLKRSREGGLGKLAFRRSLVKEMPYFHVWFELDGGMGHVVEDAARWPKGDRFAREVVGGMVDADPEVVRRQGRWDRGGDGTRVEGFQKRWRRFDWTRVLVEGLGG